MKTLLSILILVVTPIVWAAEKHASTLSVPTVVTGNVLEVKEVETYTYLRIKTKDGETWAAISRTPTQKGAKVTIENVMIMNNFESKSLKQTFKTIVFGTLAGAGTGASKTGHPTSMAHPATADPADTADIRVIKATGANAWTVAEIITKSAELKDKPVVVRGKIVKYNPGIMGKNWIHLRDGSGNAAENTHDILVTTTVEAQLGDVVAVKGVTRTDRDFGSGYVYKTLIEDATIQK